MEVDMYRGKGTRQQDVQYHHVKCLVLETHNLKTHNLLSAQATMQYVLLWNYPLPSWMKNNYTIPMRISLWQISVENSQCLKILREEWTWRPLKILPSTCNSIMPVRTPQSRGFFSAHLSGENCFMATGVLLQISVSHRAVSRGRGVQSV